MPKTFSGPDSEIIAPSMQKVPAEKKKMHPLEKWAKRRILHVINAVEDKMTKKASVEQKKSSVKRKQKHILGKKALSTIAGATILATSVQGLANHHEKNSEKILHKAEAVSEKHVDFHKKSEKLKEETGLALTNALQYGPREQKDFDVVYETLSKRFSKENMLQYAYDKVDALYPQQERNILLKKTYKGFLDTLEKLYGEPFLYLLSTVKAESNFDDISSKYFDKKTGSWKELATGYYQIIKNLTRFSKEELNDPKASNIAGYDYMLSLLSEFTISLVEQKETNAPYFKNKPRSEYIMSLMNKMCFTPERMSEKESRDIILYLSAGSNMGVTNLLKDKDALPEETRTHIAKYEKTMKTLMSLSTAHKELRRERRNVYEKKFEEKIPYKDK